MSSFTCIELNFYTPNQLLNAIKNLPNPVLLASNQAASSTISHPGRFSIASAAPTQTIAISTPTELNLLEAVRSMQPPANYPDAVANLPFIGGWLGYFAYDAGALLQPAPNRKALDFDFPLINLGYYPWALVSDNQQYKTWLVGELSSELAQQLIESLNKPSTPLEPFQLTEKFTSNLSPAAYNASFAAVQQLITEGQLEQINLTHRFSAAYTGSLFTAWHLLSAQLSAPYAAFMQLGATEILSFSPESFLQLNPTGQISSSPIKGTSPRGKTPAEDQAYIEQLIASQKDNQENLLVTQQLEQELAPLCATPIHKQLLQLESHTNVHHLVSHLRGQLQPSLTGLDAFLACFPPASIAGVPKATSLQAIDQIELGSRGIYCGALGYFDRRGGLGFNVAIRTFFAHQNKLYLGAGGGLTAASKCAAEYQETFDKINKIIKCLETNS